MRFEWMISNRFSSSGLAGGRVDSLAEKGVSARIVYRPRSLNDPMPFVVQTINEGVQLPVVLQTLECGQD
jgi:hypothetical protein